MNVPRPVFTVLLGALVIPVAGAQPPGKQHSEQVKVAVLLQMANFIDWPGNTSPESKGSLQICVLSKDHWLPLLHDALRNPANNGLAVVIRRLTRPQEAKGCHFVVIGTPAAEQPWSLWRQTTVITVGSEDGFAEAGGIVNLFEQGGRVRFELNVKAAEDMGFRFSSRMLRLAKLVRAEGG